MTKTSVFKNRKELIRIHVSENVYNFMFESFLGGQSKHSSTQVFKHILFFHLMTN